MSDLTERIFSNTSAEQTRQILGELLESIYHYARFPTPLCLALTCDEGAVIAAEDAKAFIKGLLSVPASTWATLSLEGLGSYTVYEELLASLWNHSWPNLTFLEIIASNEVIEEHLRINLALPIAPQLQQMNLQLYTRTSSSNQSLMIMQSLTRLELDSYTSRADLLFLLNFTPSLKKLNLRMHEDTLDVALPLSVDPEGVALPQLQSLILRTAFSLSILRHIQAPRLTGLHVEMMEILPLETPEINIHMKILANFIAKNCSISLTYLKLSRCPLADAALYAILAKTPSLKKLEVWWGPGLKILVDLAYIASLQNPAIPVMCPQGVACRGSECTEREQPGIPLVVPQLDEVEIYFHPIDIEREDPRLFEMFQSDQAEFLLMMTRAIPQRRRCAFAYARRLGVELGCLRKLIFQAIHHDDDEGDGALEIEI